jgi:putative CRISPR-associated protein (TIGR02620 family)
MKVVITRHQGAVEWLKRNGHVSDDVYVVAHATEFDVRGNEVYGVVPMNLALLAKVVHNIDMPAMPISARGQELTADQMDLYGAHINSYVVCTAKDWDIVCDIANGNLLRGNK